MRRSVVGVMVVAVLGLILAACAGESVVPTAQVIEVEKIITVEVPVEREVVREVPVEREVVREVEVERVVEVEKIVTVEVVTEVEVVMEKIVTVEVEKVVQVEKVLIATPTPPPTGQPRFGGTLRVVSQASIASIDPVNTPFYVTIAVAEQMYEAPFGWDAALTDQPRMVDSWSLSPDRLTYTFSLRDGLTFHNGKTVTAADIHQSLDRWLGGASSMAILWREFVTEEPVTVLDDKTFTINVHSPFTAVLRALARPHWAPFIMPAGIASTPVSEVVSEHVGSGPYKFNKWEQGHQIVLDRFAEYNPRSEPASHMVGESIAYIDRIIFLEIPDEETKIAGLQTGEWDVVDGAAFDFFKRLTADPEITVPLYKPGHRSAMNISPNNEPFGNESLIMTESNLLARQAVQATIDINAVMLALGDTDLWILCPALYYCGTPLETFAGEEKYNQANPTLGRQLLEQSDYAGETVTLFNPTDYGTITPTGVVLKQQMEEIGLDVNMPALDWATIVSNFGDTEQYHMFTDWFVHWCCESPISWPPRNGVPGRHPINEEGIELLSQFASAETFADKLELIDLIQVNMYEEVTTIFLGQWFSMYPHTSELKNFKVLSVPMYFNTWLERR